MPKKNKLMVSSLGPAELPGNPADHRLALDLMREHWAAELEAVRPDRPDLIVLPEACDRFPAMSAGERLAYYEFRGDAMLDFFREAARRDRCLIAYSAWRRLPDGSARNSTQLIGRDGEVVGIYDKNYPVDVETFNAGVLPGRDAPVIETDCGRIAMAICFDLNFHELLERYARQRPDLILFSSMYHGGLMQNYWAYHCRSYFIGAIAGLENNIINPIGERVAHSTNHFRRVSAGINLDYQVVHLHKNFGKLDQLKSRYGRGVTISDPGHLGAVLVTSELEDVSSAEMVKEFAIELWDELYNRHLEHRQQYVAL